MAVQQQQPKVYFDKKEQLDKIASGLLQGEQIYAVFDMKGGGDRLPRRHEQAPRDL